MFIKKRFAGVAAGKKSVLSTAAMSALVVMLAAVMAFGETPTITTFTDKRDGKTYKKVKIGKQVWMGQNLNYDAAGSKCGNESSGSLTENDGDCAKYGRLYNWSTAMNGASSSSQSPSGVRGVCPVGWHLPSDAEWDVLMVAVGGVKDEYDYWQGAGKQLKSASGWNEGGNGTDAHGFSALPGGRGYSSGTFYGAGNYGYWWSATEFNASYAWRWYMFCIYESVYRSSNVKAFLLAVRCAQD